MKQQSAGIAALSLLVLAILACGVTSRGGGGGTLPGPLYFLGADGQIMRLETDTETIVPITDDPDGVTTFDRSPVDGSLVYISGDGVLKHSGGGEASVETLIAGLPVQPDPGYLSPPVVIMPGGTQVAYFDGALMLLDLSSGTSQTLLEASLDGQEPKRGWYAHSPSPDGRYLLATGVEEFFRIYREFDMVIDLESGTAIVLEQRMAGQFPTWMSDSDLLFARDQGGLFLWDLAADVETELVAPENGSVEHYVIYPYSTGTDVLYYGDERASVEQAPRYNLRSASLSGGFTELGEDTVWFWHGAWHPSGAGIVVENHAGGGLFNDDPQWQYLPADGSAAIDLPALGVPIKWGQ